MKNKLIIVGPVPPPVHGVTIFMETLLKSGLKKKFNIIHLDTSDHRDISNIGAIDCINLWLALKSYLKLLFYCFKYKPEIVYVPISQSWLGYARDAFYIVAPKLVCKSKIIIHLHGGYFGIFYNRSNMLVKAFIDFTMRFADRAIVLGECLKSIFGKWFRPEMIDVVPNGTNIKINDVEEKFQRRNPRYLTVTFMSSLLRSKGIIDFILAAKLVIKQYPNTDFVIAGEWWNQEPELEDEVMSLIAKDDADSMIKFLGLVVGDKKKTLLKKTDIFVLPTYYPFEGQPIAIIEAMVAGCAVISTNLATIPEIVLHGETGLIVPPKNPQKLAEAIGYLIKNRDILRSMCKNSYERYKKFYTAERNAELLTKSLMKALAN